jgi:hypothetical protein
MQCVKMSSCMGVPFTSMSVFVNSLKFFIPFDTIYRSLYCRQLSYYSIRLTQHSHTNYRIIRPIARALTIQKRSEIVKNEHARYTLERFPNDNAPRYLYKKKRYREIRYYVLNITFNWSLFVLSIKMYNYLSSNWLQENDATHPSYLSGPMDTKKVKVQFSSWPQITRWSVHKYIHNVTRVVRVIH